MKTFNLEEFNENYLKLYEDTMSAIKELQALTGKEVIFKVVKKEECTGHFKLKIKLARAFMENHIVIINEDAVESKDEVNYYIVHEMMHGFRVFNAEPKDRKILSSNSDSLKNLKQQAMAEIDENIKTIMDEYSLNQYCSNLIYGVNAILFNNPVDARIELAIYDKYPNLRKIQKQAQKSFLKELQVGFVNKDAKTMVPKCILNRTNLMNYCYMQKITPIIGKGWTSKINACIDEDFKSTVEKMMYYLDKEDLGQISDTKTIEEWAKILGLDEYTNFRDFEDVNYDYLMTN